MQLMHAEKAYLHISLGCRLRVGRELGIHTVNLDCYFSTLVILRNDNVVITS